MGLSSKVGLKYFVKYELVDWITIALLVIRLQLKFIKAETNKRKVKPKLKIVWFSFFMPLTDS